MKLSLLIHFFILVFCTWFLSSSASGQSITGIWRGYFITETGDQYKYELQIDESSSGNLHGVSYSYLDTRFYGKALLKGNFAKSGGSALVEETKTVEVKMSSGSSACIMKCFFTYAKSGKEEFLEGTFSSAYENSEPLLGIKKGGNCGGGKVFLRKVPTSDFYEEPFLKDKITPKTEETIKETPVIKATPPVAKKTVIKHKTVTKPIANAKPKTTKPLTQKQKVTVKAPSNKKIIRDTIVTHRTTTGPVVMDKPIETPKFSPPVVTRSRQNELVQTLTVSSEEIIVRLYDNGEVDDDTVSVYLDGKPLALNKRLSTVPIVLSLKMDEANPDHTLVMYAENMGRIPPNTSLMIVQDGDKRYQVSIVSTEQKNAMVRFRYVKHKE